MSKLKILTLTWNMSGKDTSRSKESWEKSVVGQEWKNWLRGAGSNPNEALEGGTGQIDIVVVGLQEVHRNGQFGEFMLDALNASLSKSRKTPAQIADERFTMAVAKNKSAARLAGVSFDQHIYVFYRKRDGFSVAKRGSTCFGAGGSCVKGSVAIHLHRRNEHYILVTSHFPLGGDVGVEGDLARTAAYHSTMDNLMPQMLTVAGHSIPLDKATVVWCGDINFRTNRGSRGESTKQGDNYQDRLSLQRALGKAPFPYNQGWRESGETQQDSNFKPNYQPTCKMDKVKRKVLNEGAMRSMARIRHEGLKDAYVMETKKGWRNPSWCDRVFIKSPTSFSGKSNKFSTGSVESDHDAVFAELALSGVTVGEPLVQGAIEEWHDFLEDAAAIGELIGVRSDEQIDEIIQALERQWTKNVLSAGSNNSTTLAGMKKVFDALNAAEPFTASSVLVDLGSGAGLPVIYAALKYGIRAHGVDSDPSLVATANSYARQASVDDLVSFKTNDISRLTVEWFTERKITHVYSYDVVFLTEPWNAVFDVLEQLPVTGASTKRFKSNWPESFELITTVDRVMLAGSKSGFAFGIWRNKPVQAERDRSPERSVGCNPPRAPKTIAEEIGSSWQFDTLADSLRKTGLDSVLNGAGPFTIFAPDDRAWTGMPDGTIGPLMRDDDLLKQTLLEHVVAGEFCQMKIHTSSPFTSVGGTPLVVSYDENGDARVNGALVKNSQRMQNGYIHTIDKVLLGGEIDASQPIEALRSRSTAWKEVLSDHAALIMERSSAISRNSEVTLLATNNRLSANMIQWKLGRSSTSRELQGHLVQLNNALREVSQALLGGQEAKLADAKRAAHTAASQFALAFHKNKPLRSRNQRNDYQAAMKEYTQCLINYATDTQRLTSAKSNVDITTAKKTQENRGRECLRLSQAVAAVLEGGAWSLRLSEELEPIDSLLSRTQTIATVLERTIPLKDFWLAAAENNTELLAKLDGKGPFTVLVPRRGTLPRDYLKKVNTIPQTLNNHVIPQKVDLKRLRGQTRLKVVALPFADHAAQEIVFERNAAGVVEVKNSAGKVLAKVTKHATLSSPVTARNGVIYLITYPLPEKL